MGDAGGWVTGGCRSINTKLDDLSPEREREGKERWMYERKGEGKNKRAQLP